jgi:hypothetical protein
MAAAAPIHHLRQTNMLSLALCVQSVQGLIFYSFSYLLKITTIEGNGAEFLLSPNFNLPFRNLTSALL